MVQTITVYEGQIGSPAFMSEVDAQIAICVAEGTTDGNKIVTFNSELNQRQVKRNWINTASAHSFLEFLNTLEPPAISKEILE